MAETPVPVQDEQSALAHIRGILDSENAAPAETTDEPAVENTQEETVSETPFADPDPDLANSQNAEPEAEAEETADAEPSETEPEAETEGETDEGFPASAEGLAEAAGLDFEDFANQFTITVNTPDGGPEEITLHELQRGFLRQSDFTRKTQELTQDRQQFVDRVAETQNHFAAKAQQMDLLISQLQQQVETVTEEDLNYLLATDTDEYTRVKAKRDAQLQSLAAAEQHRQMDLQQQAQLGQQQLAEHRAEQQRLLLVEMPDLREDAQRDHFMKDMEGYLLGQGYTQDEIDQYTSGAWSVKQIRVIRDAMRFRGLEAGKKTIAKKLKGKPRVMKPGAAPQRGKPDDALTSAKSRMKKAPSRENVLNWIKATGMAG